MSAFIIGGVASLSAAIVGIRLYNSYFVWGSYKNMVDQRLNEFSNRLNGKTFIVTGANCGIGKETTRELFKHGARVILACRNEQEALQLIDQFTKQYPQSSGQLAYRHLDLSSFASVRQFAQQVKEEEAQVHTLINNAAIFGAPFDMTADGYEINMQVNHLAPALLTILLLPKLQMTKSTDPLTGKVIMVSSTLYKSGKIDYQLLNKVDNSKLLELRQSKQPSKVVYASSKLVNLLFTRQLSLQKDLTKNVDICLASPGFTLTRLHRYASKRRLLLLSLFAPLFVMVLKSSKQGSQTIIGCAMTNNVRSDVLYHNCKPNEKLFQDGIANDTRSGEQIFQLTMQTLNEYVQN